MNVSDIYIIRLGYYQDKYLVIGNYNGTFVLKRIRRPETKIDAVRLPEIISIGYFGSTFTKKQKKLIKNELT